MKNFDSALAALNSTIDFDKAESAGQVLDVKVGTAIDALGIALRAGQEADEALALVRAELLAAVDDHKPTPEPEEVTPRERRMIEISEAVRDLCKAVVEHERIAHEYRHSDFWPSEHKVEAAQQHLIDVLDQNA